MTLEYWNSLASQMILISSLLGGFSMAIVANIIVSSRDDKPTNRILKTATVSACCFLITLFAMTKIFMDTTPGGFVSAVSEGDFMLPRMIGMVTFFIGLTGLSVLIALSGWTKSKKVGRFTTVIGIIQFVLTLMTLIEIKL
jgi:uncharacterized membrane protein YozB (DUF420 family)